MGSVPGVAWGRLKAEVVVQVWGPAQGSPCGSGSKESAC